jgi:hypothetical protein
MIELLVNRSAAPRRSRVVAVCAVGAMFSCWGCGSDASDDGAKQGSRGTILLQDENNYSSVSSLSIPVVQTAVGDLDICWKDAVKDLQCHDVDPVAELDNVSLLRFLHLSNEEVEKKLTSGQLSQSQVDGYLDFKTDHDSTCTKLSALSFFGTEIDVAKEYVASSERKYMLIFSKGTTPGVGARTMTFIEPTEDSTNTVVDAPEGCGMLDFKANLSDAVPMAVGAKAPWLVDWQDVTVDGQRNPIAYQSIDRLMLGFFQDATVAELQDRIFDIEQIATSLWELPLTGGRKAELSFAEERTTGEPFAGFDRTDGVWLLALLCSTCQNPQPVVLSVLAPGDGQP